MEFKVHFKEKLYFTIMIITSLLLYLALIGGGLFGPYLTIISCYVAIFFIFSVLSSILAIGHLRGNAIKVNNKQFPEIFEILKNQSTELGLSKIPTLYLLQGNGILNAFATKFAGQNYIVLYSDIVTAAYQEGISAVEFIIGHELGHIKRNHVGMVKSLLLLPAKLIPLLGFAYSRACEYTCDNIGYNLCPEGAEKGILILAAGKELYKKVNVDELLWNIGDEQGLITGYAELFSTHPHLVKRIAIINKLNRDNNTSATTFFCSKDLLATEKQN